MKQLLSAIALTMLFAFHDIRIIDQLTITVSTTSATCTANGRIAVTATGGTPQYIYRLDSVGGRTIRPAQNSPIFDALQRGSYIVVVTDAVGNLVSAEAVVFGNYILPILTSVRNGSTIRLIVTGGVGTMRYTFSKNGIPSADTTTNPVFHCMDGDLEFRVFDECGNFFSHQVSIRAADYYLTLDSCKTLIDGTTLIVHAFGATNPVQYICDNGMGRRDTNPTGIFRGWVGCGFKITAIDSCGRHIERQFDCQNSNLQLKILCVNTSDGTATLRASGGTEGYVFEETNSGIRSTNGVFIGLSRRRIYYFRVMDACQRTRFATAYPLRIERIQYDTCPFTGRLTLDIYQPVSSDTSFRISPLTVTLLNSTPSVIRTDSIAYSSTRIVFDTLSVGFKRIRIKTACGETLDTTIEMHRSKLLLSVSTPCTGGGISAITGVPNTIFSLKIGDSTIATANGGASGRATFAVTNLAAIYTIVATHPNCLDTKDSVSFSPTMRLKYGCNFVEVEACPRVAGFTFYLINQNGDTVATNTDGVFRELENNHNYRLIGRHASLNQPLESNFRTTSLPALFVPEDRRSFCSIVVKPVDPFDYGDQPIRYDAYDSLTNQLVLTTSSDSITGLQHSTAYRIVATHPCGTQTLYTHTREIPPLQITLRPYYYPPFQWYVTLANPSQRMTLRNLQTGNSTTVGSEFIVSPSRYVLTREGCRMDTLDFPPPIRDFLTGRLLRVCPQGGSFEVKGAPNADTTWRNHGLTNGSWRMTNQYPSGFTAQLFYYLYDSTGRTPVRNAAGSPISSPSGLFDNVIECRNYTVYAGFTNAFPFLDTFLINVPCYERPNVVAFFNPPCPDSATGSITVRILRGNLPCRIDLRGTNISFWTNQRETTIFGLTPAFYNILVSDLCGISSDFSGSVGRLRLNSQYANRRCMDSIEVVTTFVDNGIYIWRDGLNRIIGTSATVPVFNQQATNNIYYVELKLGNCSFFDTLRIPAFEVRTPNAQAGRDTTVVGLSALLNATPTPTYSLRGGKWTAVDSSVIFSNSALPNTTVTVPRYRPYTLIWTVSGNLSGCSHSDTVVVEFVRCLPRSYRSEERICKGDGFPIADTVLRTAGLHSILRTSLEGCRDTYFINLSFKRRDTTLLTAKICWDESYSFDGQRLTKSGKYSMRLQNTEGCDSTIYLYLTVDSQLFKHRYDTVCLGEVYEIDARSYQKDTVHYRNIFNSIGCTWTEIWHIRFKPCVPVIYVPNAFSPNNDGINDVFYPFSKSNQPIRITDFKVFDRWGGLVFKNQLFFEPDNPNEGWDGTMNGWEASEDVYIWLMEIVYGAGKRAILKGDVTLMR